MTDDQKIADALREAREHGYCPFHNAESLPCPVRAQRRLAGEKPWRLQPVQGPGRRRAGKGE